MFSGPNRDNWVFARQLGLRITSEFQGPMAGDLLDPLWQEKLVGPDKHLQPLRRAARTDMADPARFRCHGRCVPAF